MAAFIGDDQAVGQIVGMQTKGGEIGCPGVDLTGQARSRRRRV
ncbi:hypothetical protein FHS42_005978 [Streptomyces zagrosensis]|uniref:Uncharacterized protein n=1 Tax=Streptomyces zagrosensis TaxID=1042984 RepID=A0A7W9QH22_9ACTN|nr:hypothetical protein [Streptomyces zagrosensis]